MAILVAGFLAWLRGEWFGPAATLWFSDLAQLAAPAVAAWMCWRQARTLRGPLATMWTLLALAAASWAVGQAVWSFYELDLHQEAPVATLAEPGFLLFPVFAGAALIYLGCKGATWNRRIRLLLDGAVTASLLLFMGWAFFLYDAWQETSTDLLERILLLWYPVADIFIVAAAIVVSARLPRDGWLTTGLLTAGLVTLSVADTAFLYLNFRGTYATGQPVDAGWFLGFLLIALAAASPRPLRDIAEPRRSNLFMDFLPVGSILAAVAIAAYAISRYGGLGGSFFWIAATYASLLVVRQAMTVAENRSLWRRAETNVADLEEQQRFRSEMLNTLTHDLLNPLNAIKLQLYLSRMGADQLNQQHRQALEIVTRNVDHVVRLGKDFKDVANLDSGHLPMTLEPVDVVRLSRDAVASYSDLASERGLTLRLEGTKTAPASADPGRITQVLYNLLSNALKFTPSGGTVTVTATHGSGAHVAVSDTGRGLDAREIDRVFRPFSQVHERDEVQERGTGLGLFISKGIVENHGGLMGVHSRGRGRGSTFWFTLPDVDHSEAPGA